MPGSSWWRPKVALVILVASAAACTSTAPVSSAAGSAPSKVSRSPLRESSAAFTWPRQAPVVATIRAPKPSADDVRLYTPILLEAYRRACPDVMRVQSAFRRFHSQSELILIRCGDAPVRAVRLVFTGVVVPNMRPVIRDGGMQPQNALALLGLRWHFARHAARGPRPRLMSQEPRAGEVVPFGTVVHVVIAS